MPFVVLVPGAGRNLQHVSAQPSLTWRPRTSSRLLAGISAVGFFASAVYFTITDDGGDPEAAPGWWLGLIFGTAALACLSVAVRVNISIEGPTVVVRNLLRTHERPLRDLHGVEAGDYGLRMSFEEHGAVMASAVQKSRLALIRQRRVRADDVAASILAERDRQAR